MIDITTGLLVSLAVFAGAFVSGLAGFAFSAVAGAVLLHVFPAPEAVPLMMFCSIVIQAINLWALRNHIRWAGSAPLIVGGLLGVPLAIYLLQNADTRLLRLGFGFVVSLYAAYMLFRPKMVEVSEHLAGKFVTALIGFGGGLVGGLTAMPGAVPTIWCDMRGMSKGGQRGLVQPYIAAMQLSALAILLGRQNLSSKIAMDFALSIPAMLAGSLLGLLAFRHVNELMFRKAILVMLLISGSALIIA